MIITLSFLVCLTLSADACFMGSGSLSSGVDVASTGLLTFVVLEIFKSLAPCDRLEIITMLLCAADLTDC